MSTNNDEPAEHNMDGQPDVAECGPGCDCDAPGLSTKGKIIVCLVVCLAAAAVLARGIMKRTGAESDGDQQSFATVLPVVGAEEPTSSEGKASEGAEKEDAKSTLWGNPLNSLASLNKVASEKDAVFVFLPAGSDEEVNAIKTQVEATAKKIISRGTTMAAFTLDKNTKDYTQITSQAPAPCVLTMVKGRGMSVVSKDITEASLLQALVTASRPSDCAPAASSSCCP